MRISSPVESVLVRTLRSVFSAETQRLRILPATSLRASHAELRGTLYDLVGVGEAHLGRLELIAQHHDIPLTEKGAYGMRGLVEAIEDTLAEEDDSFITDLALAGLVDRTGHYLKALYGSARTQATELGWSKTLAMINANLEEEEETSDVLTELRLRLADIAAGKRGRVLAFSRK